MQGSQANPTPSLRENPSLRGRIVRFVRSNPKIPPPLRRGIKGVGNQSVIANIRKNVKQSTPRKSNKNTKSMPQMQIKATLLGKLKSRG